MRLFKPLIGKKEFVLTFYGSGTFDYWQVEESDWTDAPLFANPTVDVRLQGPEIRGVHERRQDPEDRLREGKAVYWVQNTILNSLSNATMIAIAESLQTHH